jgi:hypothetical protein
MEPMRSEPMRSEPMRSEPMRSEPMRSEPISITIKNQYSLKHGLFLPIQNSPPSIWKDRLLKRANVML